MTNLTKSGKAKLTTTIDDGLLKKAKKKAIDEDRNLNEVIEELLREWV